LSYRRPLIYRNLIDRYNSFMEKKVVIFDFDGTIADTIQEGVRLYNEFAPKYGLKPITPENMTNLRSRQPREGLRELGIPMYKMAFLASKMRTAIRAGIAQAQTFPGMIEVLRELKVRGYHLIIASSNSVDNIRLFLRNNTMEGYFEQIHSGTAIFGKAKQLNQIIKEYGYNREDVYYIGDEVRDIEAAKTARLKSVAVTWGMNDNVALGVLLPEHIINKPEELLDIFE
jgi:phosphoglycolate phosphatase